MSVCPNCEADTHRQCCARCGRITARTRRGETYCTLRCDDAQREADRISAQMEADEQADAQPTAGADTEEGQR